MNEYLFYEENIVIPYSNVDSPEISYTDEIENPEDYFEDLGYGTGWTLTNEIEVDDISGVIIIDCENIINYKQSNQLGYLFWHTYVSLCDKICFSK